jgi:hypothetical protein
MSTNNGGVWASVPSYSMRRQVAHPNPQTLEIHCELLSQDSCSAATYTFPTA